MVMPSLYSRPPFFQNSPGGRLSEPAKPACTYGGVYIIAHYMVEVKKYIVDIVILQSIDVHFLRPTAPLFSCRIITSITKPGKAKLTHFN